jgi:hypothetical protein
MPKLPEWLRVFKVAILPWLLTGRQPLHPGHFITASVIPFLFYASDARGRNIGGRTARQGLHPTAARPYPMGSLCG